MKNILHEFCKKSPPLWGLGAALCLLPLSLSAQAPNAAAPTTAAPTPTLLQSSVKSVFSDHYAQFAKFDLVTDWSGTKSEKAIVNPVTDNPADRILEIDNLVSGAEALIALGTCDWSNMDSVHIDIFSPDNNQGIGEFDFALLSNFTGGQKGQADVWLDITTAKRHGQWIGIDVPISKFAGGSLQLNKISNLQIRRGAKGSAGKLLYVDNIYAYQGRGEAVVSSVNISGATWIQHNP
ncbi:MAG: hypothetical protein LBL94_04305, partial [Prevotellaceae bacterium]|nr:hypothetical protein [Prevotellaceae bacterium]